VQRADERLHQVEHDVLQNLKLRLESGLRNYRPPCLF